jgi:Tol biopolymer transport system component
VASALLLAAATACGSGSSPPAEPPYSADSLEFAYLTDERWVSSENLQVAVNSQDAERDLLTTGFQDYKPSWSLERDRITFFRLLESGPSFDVWKTKLCVVNSDGTGYRELSDGRYADFNMTWTRDGSHLVIFNRYAVDGPNSNRIYLIDPEGRPGDEVLVSDLSQGFEWAYSGLRDGRIFIDRSNANEYAPYLLTPSPGGIGRYERITRPHPNLAWHKLSVSPSETRVAYMLDMERMGGTSYADSVLYYADFDLGALTVSNAVQITELSLAYTDMYPRWSADEQLIVYDSDRTGIGQLYGYRLSDGITRRISPDSSVGYHFGNFERCPK